MRGWEGSGRWSSMSTSCLKISMILFILVYEWCTSCRGLGSRWSAARTHLSCRSRTGTWWRLTLADSQALLDWTPRWCIQSRTGSRKRWSWCNTLPIYDSMYMPPTRILDSTLCVLFYSSHWCCELDGTAHRPWQAGGWLKWW